MPDDKDLDPIIIATAHEWGVPPQFIKALIKQETNVTFNQYTFRYEPIYQRDYIEPQKRKYTPFLLDDGPSLLLADVSPRRVSLQYRKRVPQ